MADLQGTARLHPAEDMGRLRLITALHPPIMGRRRPITVRLRRTVVVGEAGIQEVVTREVGTRVGEAVIQEAAVAVIQEAAVAVIPGMEDNT
jgi:hypothetical protein